MPVTEETQINSDIELEKEEKKEKENLSVDKMIENLWIIKHRTSCIEY